MKGERGRGTLAKEKPPIFGMIPRTGQVVVRMLSDAKPETIAPLLRRAIDQGTVVYIDVDDIYSQLTGWGYNPRTVCHAAGVFARDEDGEVSVKFLST
ncbi:MAG: transposase, partial [Planctomycetaceae bacterium]|nr:transposase [Planctomycetaceae bacterium]